MLQVTYERNHLLNNRLLNTHHLGYQFKHRPSYQFSHHPSYRFNHRL